MNEYPLADGRRVEGGFAVYPNSLLFKAGDYADKNLTITPAELAAAAAKFTPLEFNSEHDTHGVHKAVLSGIGKHFGGLGGPRKVWIDPAAPDTLRGEVAVPLWLDSELETKSLSMEIDRASKTFVGAGLTYTPRVSEAALMSACVNFALTQSDFANTRHNTPEGQIVMQNLHDTAARAGAVCDKKNAQMSSQHEATAIQKIHDMTTSHGATCKSGDAPGWAKSGLFSKFHTTTDTRPAQSAKGETKPMPLMDKLMALFTKAGVPEEELAVFTADDFAPAPTPVNFADTPEAKALNAKIAALEAKATADFAASVAKDAAAFADQMVTESRAYPAEKPALIAAFMQAAQDDARDGAKVTFTSGSDTLSVSRVDTLKAVYASRPVHALTIEQITAGAHGVLANFTTKKNDAVLDADTRCAMLAQTELGRKILADEARK